MATLCARQGHDVTIFEADPAPRPSVGESLLPYGHRVWAKLGLDLSDTVVKPGAVFFRNERSERIDFSESKACPYKTAFQVDRRVLDPRLRALAREAGARFLIENRRETPRGFDWVVDATGRRRSLGRGWTAYEKHPILRNLAYGAHFSNVRFPDSCERGDIAIIAEDGMWFWLIPLGGEITSVGVVLTSGMEKASFEEACVQSKPMRAALMDATQLSKTRGFSDFTETARRFCGPGDFCAEGWALVGDAAFFLDPVFSSGVLFALESADRLCDVICEEKSSEQYESDMRTASTMMENLVLGFYSGDFLELAFSPAQYQSADIRSGLVGLLAGNLFDHCTRTERMVARRFSGLVDLTRGRVPVEHHLNAPIVARDERFDLAFRRNEALIPT